MWGATQCLGLHSLTFFLAFKDREHKGLDLNLDWKMVSLRADKVLNWQLTISSLKGGKTNKKCSFELDMSKKVARQIKSAHLNWTLVKKWQAE
jgi:hypothetical protein